MVPFESWSNFLFAFYINYSRMLCRFGHKASYWLKIAIFSYPLHSMPMLGGPHRNIAILLV